MVILDIDIENVDRSIESASLVVQVLQDGIKAAFFASNDDIDDARFGTFRTLVGGMFQPWLAWHPILEPLGVLLDCEIATEHVQQPIGRIQASILRRQLIVHVLVCSAVEVVNVRLVDRRAGQAHERASAEGDGGELRRGELEMGFHRPGHISE